jgi:predicted Ser/Thr protein kinase
MENYWRLSLKSLVDYFPRLVFFTGFISDFYNFLKGTELSINKRRKYNKSSIELR